MKNLPVASGIGGGSSDAAAALRLIARLNGIDPDDSRLTDAARTLGADVPVCLDPSAPRLMHGIGHELGNRLYGLRYPAVLVNPVVPLETRAVFGSLGLSPGDRFVPMAIETPCDLKALTGTAMTLKRRPRRWCRKSAPCWGLCVHRTDAVSRGCPVPVRHVSRFSTIIPRQPKRLLACKSSRNGGRGRPG